MLLLYQGLIGTITEGGTWEYIGDDPNAPLAPTTWDGGINDNALTPGSSHQYRYTVQGDCGNQHSSVVTVYKTFDRPHENDDCASAKILFFFNQTTAFKNREFNGTSCVLQGDEPPIKQLPPTLDDVMPFTGAHDLWYRINIPRLDDGNEYELLATIDGELYSGAGISNITAAGYTGQCGSLTEVGTGTTNSQKLVFSSDIGLRSAAQTFYLRVGTTGTLAANGTTGNEGRFNLTLKLQTI